jgi:hypothetical protein
MREGPQRREGTTCVLPSPTVVTGATSLSILAFFLLQSTCALLPPWLLLFSFSTSTLYSLSLSLAFLQLTLAQSRSPNPSTSLSLTCFSPINPCSVSLTQSIHLYVLFLPLFLLAGLASCSTFDSPLLCYCCCSFLFSVLTCCPSSAYRSPLAPPAAPASGQSAFPPRFALSCRNKAKQSRLLLEAERQESGGTEPRGKQDEILGEKHRRRLRRRRPGRKQCVFAHFRALNSRQTGLQLVDLH